MAVLHVACKALAGTAVSTLASMAAIMLGATALSTGWSVVAVAQEYQEGNAPQNPPKHHKGNAPKKRPAKYHEGNAPKNPQGKYHEGNAPKNPQGKYHGGNAPQNPPPPNPPAKYQEGNAPPNPPAQNPPAKYQEANAQGNQRPGGGGGSSGGAPGGGAGGAGAGGGGAGGGGAGGGRAAVDPGPRAGAPGAGDPLPGLSQAEIDLFNAAKDQFNQVEAVPDGLGPRYNLDSCGGCHIFPTVGGSSPPTNNPQIASATADGATNTVPSFITANGPIREVRFVNNPDGSPDGGVHDLFTITGRADAPGCVLKQPDFAGAVAANNAIFRIPTPVFGLGLVENTADSTLQAAFDANATMKESLGISGHFNRSGNDGTITRFGWKAQNKSLLIFAGEAYNVEMGVTNENFPNERENDPNCQFNSLPENPTPFVSENTGVPAADFQGDIVLFAIFMRGLAPPTPASTTVTVASAGGSVAGTAAGTGSSTVSRGQQVFANIGCAGCHNPTLTTAKSQATGQSNVTYHSYSDYAVHDMGTGLADRVSQGNANGQEFRSAPLWGAGQRVFFLHDGRTSDIVQAINQHFSEGSEANAVISNYRQLPTSDQQALVYFLRSL